MNPPLKIRPDASGFQFSDPTPEQEAAIRRVAQGWADKNDAMIAARIYAEFYGDEVAWP